MQSSMPMPTTATSRNVLTKLIKEYRALESVDEIEVGRASEGPVQSWIRAQGRACSSS